MTMVCFVVDGKSPMMTELPRGTGVAVSKFSNNIWKLMELQWNGGSAGFSQLSLSQVSELNVQKYSNSLTQHSRTRNLNASVYILSINWYIRSDCEMWQRTVATEGVGARYRCNVQQYLLILIYTYGTQFIKWRKNEGGSKILNWGRGTLRFRVLLCCMRRWTGVFLDV